MKFEKKKLFCSYIDFSKAFDSVWRIGLWRKLLPSEINRNFFRVIHNMYQNIKSCVSVGGENSLFFTSNCGVRQGDNLSPVLFSMILNDLEDHMMSDRVNRISVVCDNDQITYFMKIYILLIKCSVIVLKHIHPIISHLDRLRLFGHSKCNMTLTDSHTSKYIRLYITFFTMKD